MHRMVFILSPRIIFPLGVNPRMQNQVCYIKARYLSLVCVFIEILPMTLPSVSIKIIWLLTHAEPTSVPKRHFTNTPFHHYHLATCVVIKASLVSFTFWYSIVMVCLKWCQHHQLSLSSDVCHRSTRAKCATLQTARIDTF